MEASPVAFPKLPAQSVSGSLSTILSLTLFFVSVTSSSKANSTVAPVISVLLLVTGS